MTDLTADTAFSLVAKQACSYLHRQAQRFVLRDRSQRRSTTSLVHQSNLRNVLDDMRGRLTDERRVASDPVSSGAAKQLQIDAALAQLAGVDARIFGGLKFEEALEATGMSERERNWAHVRAVRYRELSQATS